MPTIANDDIYKDNDADVEIGIQRKKTTSGELEMATGLTGISAWISATEGGGEINAAVKVALAERSANPGFYFGTIQGDAITTHLFGATSYDGKPVYIVFADTGQNLRTSLPRRAFAVRRA